MYKRQLHPLSATERAQKFVNIARKQTKISDEAESALTNGEYQWALELADILLALDPDSTNAKNIKANAAEKLSQYQLASNDYYFYRTVAGELRNEINVDPSTANSVTPEQLEATPIDAIMNILPVNLNSEKSEEIIKTYQFSFTDSEENYSVYVRRGVAQISKYPEPNAEIKVITDQQTLKEVFGGLKNLSAISLLLANNTINVEGSKLEFLQFLDLFTD